MKNAYQTYDFNEIIMDPKGNTYVGSLASKFAYTPALRDQLDRFSLDQMITHPLGQFWIVEVMDDGTLITRAGQSQHSLAMRFMGPNRIICWHSALWNVKDARNLVCGIRGHAS